MPVHCIRYRLESPSPLLDYGLQFILNSLGFAAQATEGDDYHLYYGQHAPAQAPIFIQAQPNLSTILWPELWQDQAELADGQIAFDVLQAIIALLTDQVNADLPPQAYGRFDWINVEATFQGRTGLSLIPVVNHYLQPIRQAIRQQLGWSGLPLYPDGKRYAIGLSHDVDRLQRRGLIKALLYMRYRGILPTWTTPEGLRGLMTAFLSNASADDDFQRFRQVLSLEESFGFRSTFFFSALPFLSRYRGLVDILYDIAHPNFICLFAELQEQGFSIGLHPSYHTHQALERFLEQKHRLERNLGQTVKGVRHHYWHIGPNELRTLAYHQAAGFAYDSSLGFEKTMALRRSVALPYFPWNPAHQAPLTVMQMPVILMDGYIFYEDRQQPVIDFGLAQYQVMVTLLRASQGLAVVDWHSDTAHAATPNFERWGHGYATLLTLLAQQSDAWVTDLETLHDWFIQRHQQLTLAVR
jgi:hypothetical protein